MHIVLGAVVLLVTFVLLTEAKLWRSGDIFHLENNSQIGEATSWWEGRLDLPRRMWDTALKDGKVYSHFPPMFTMLAALVVPFLGGVPHWLVVVALALPVPLLAAALVMAALMLYQNTGWTQRGFNRYSLDYIPVVLGVIAPRCIEGRRKWISLAMIVWSVVYFRWLV